MSAAFVPRPSPPLVVQPLFTGDDSSKESSLLKILSPPGGRRWRFWRPYGSLWHMCVYKTCIISCHGKHILVYTVESV